MRLRSLAATLAALTLAVPLTVAADGGDAVGTAAFDALSVDVVDGEIVVSGTATFGGEAVVVGEDPSLDAAMPGTDMTALTVSQEDGVVTFVMDLEGAFPETATAPDGVFFEWNVDVPSADEAALTAKFIDQSNGASGWYFAFTTFSVNEATGTGEFSPTTVDGEFTGSSLVWRVPVAQLGGEGARIAQGARGPVRATIGVAGAATWTVANYDDMLMSEKFRLGGGATVTVLDADGEEVDEVDARVRRGEFAATVKDLEPGTYTVVVTTGYGDAEVSETFTVTI